MPRNRRRLPLLGRVGRLGLRRCVGHGHPLSHGTWWRRHVTEERRGPKGTLGDRHRRDIGHGAPNASRCIDLYAWGHDDIVGPKNPASPEAARAASNMLYSLSLGPMPAAAASGEATSANSSSAPSTWQPDQRDPIHSNPASFAFLRKPANQPWGPTATTLLYPSLRHKMKGGKVMSEHPPNFTGPTHHRDKEALAAGGA